MLKPWSRLANRPPLVRILAFLVGLVGLWAPLALPLYWLSGQGWLPGGDLVPTALLYLLFLAILPIWQRQVHRATHPWRQLGVWVNPAVGLSALRSLLLGWGSLGLLVWLQVGLGWARLNPVTSGLVGVVLAGGITALAVAAAEELLFRGWLLQELEQGLRPSTALIVSGLIFALAHFIKPLATMLAMLPQFFGLLLLGLTLGWARRIPVVAEGRTGTALGAPVGLHGGLVWGYYIIDVGNLIQPSGAVPDWITGLQGNPLAGVLGVSLLGILAGLFCRWSKAPAPAQPES